MRRLLPAELGHTRIHLAGLRARQATGAQGLQAQLFAAVRSDMLEVQVSDFLLTAKGISFTTLEDVNIVQ